LEPIASYIQTISIFALPVMFAIIIHEVMHGVVALRLGDDTAKRAGRLTLNPLPHIDLFGTILMPAFLLLFHLPVFGYAKPVPVDFSRLRGGRAGMIKVAAAGPLTNLALAAASAIAIRAIVRIQWSGPIEVAFARPLAQMALASVVINVALGVFNLLPLLPLDGGRVLAGILPLGAARAFARTEPYGFLILLVLLSTDLVDVVINPIINSITRVLL
jgi:Zn-dependent protease